VKNILTINVDAFVYGHLPDKNAFILNACVHRLWVCWIQ